MAARAAGGGGAGADCAYLGQGSAAQTCNLSPGPARGRVCFCSSGGRLVPGIGGSVSACFLYISALCLCKTLPLHADCRLLHKPAAVTVNRRVGHSGIRICKNMGSLYPVSRKRSCLPPSKPMLYLTAPVRAQTYIFMQLCCLKGGLSSLHEVPAGTVRRLNKPRARHYKASPWRLAVWNL